jgi:hypothetical protein
MFWVIKAGGAILVLAGLAGSGGGLFVALSNGMQKKSIQFWILQRASLSSGSLGIFIAHEESAIGFFWIWLLIAAVGLLHIQYLAWSELRKILTSYE